MTKRTLEGDLRALLNSYSLENESDTPDFILAQYLLACLQAYNHAAAMRQADQSRSDPPAAYEGPIDVNWS